MDNAEIIREDSFVQFSKVKLIQKPRLQLHRVNKEVSCRPIFLYGAAARLKPQAPPEVVVT